MSKVAQIMVYDWNVVHGYKRFDAA